MTLPSLYHALGKYIDAEGKLRDEFVTNYQTIDTLHNQVKEREAHSANQPKTEGIAAKAKPTVKVIQDMVQAKFLTMKLGHALTGLGKAAFEKHGEQSGPEQLTQPIVVAQARLAALDVEIGQLSQAKPGQILTSKRIAIGGVVLLALWVSGVVLHLFGVDGLSSNRSTYHSQHSRLLNGIDRNTPRHMRPARSSQASGASSTEQASQLSLVSLMTFSPLYPPLLSVAILGMDLPRFARKGSADSLTSRVSVLLRVSLMILMTIPMPGSQTAWHLLAGMIGGDSLIRLAGSLSTSNTTKHVRSMKDLLLCKRGKSGDSLTDREKLSSVFCLIRFTASAKTVLPFVLAAK